MFWRKPKAPGRASAALPISVLFHWYCYDTGVSDPNEVAKMVGLAPISEDVAAMELKASDKRIDRVASIVPFLDVMSELNGLVTSKRQATTLRESLDVPEDKMEMIEDHIAATFTLVSLNALISTFSAALELGLITYGDTTSVGMVDKDGYE